ncbi:hypothetical protein Tco_0415300 [Tanacetum coccineum]
MHHSTCSSTSSLVFMVLVLSLRAIIPVVPLIPTFIVLGLKRLHGFLEVTAAQVHNGNYAKCAAGGKITTV